MPTPVPADAVVAEIADAGGTAMADGSDVADREGRGGARRLRPSTHFGRIDVVVNNAGIMRWAAFPDVDLDDLERHLAVHVDGSFNTRSRRLAPPGRSRATAGSS